MRDIWETYPAKLELRSSLSEKLSVSPVVAQLLINRGLETQEDGWAFLNPDLKSLHDPYLLKDMKRAVDRIKTAMSRGEKILIYGDYDVDGTCGVSIILRALSKLGVEADYYIPDRFDEGYGLNEGAIVKAKEKGVGLIVSVDCGISSIKEVECANDLGIDVIINDHHRPGVTLPPAVAIINPKQDDCPYPYKELCSAGVALKLMQALWKDIKGPRSDSELLEHLDLVALATVADIVPLTGENRVLVAYGLKKIRDTDKVGIKALIEVSGITKEDVDSWHIGYLLGPRINAGGRLSTALMCVRLLTTDSQAEARKLAEELNGENQRRKEIESGILEGTIGMVEAGGYLDDFVLTLASPDWHPGVIGIVASRLLERYHRPVALIALEGGEGRGSMRGIVKFNVFDALHRCSDLFSKYGGHPMAGGFSISEGNIPELRRRLNLVAQETLSKSDLVSATRVDMEIPLDMVDLSLIREVDRLAPFGHGNREPVFSSGDAEVVPGSVRMAGKDHLKVRFRTSKGALDAIGFRMGSLVNRLAAMKDNSNPLDIAYRVQENRWGGLLAPQISLKSIIIERDLLEDVGEAENEDQDVSFVRLLYRADAPDRGSALSGDKRIVVSSDDKAVSTEYRRQLSRLGQSELIESIRNHLLGDTPYNPAESQAIEYLLSGDSTLAVLPPGRSYEVILQAAAAVKAIRDGQATLVVCPFRAAADSRHSALQEELASLGIGVVRADGSLSSAGWEELERSVSMGEADVILVTSEHLGDHLDRLSGVKSRLGLMVVDGTGALDGARHLRPRFYKDLSQAAAQLGSPVTLVVADADDGLSRQIMEALRIKRLVVGAHRRNNLMLIDRRGIFGKDSYVADLVGSGEKTIIYLEGQGEVARVARFLCRRHQGMFKEGRIAFYHAGMSAGTKSNLERLFGSGVISAVVSTDDFGKGVRDIRHLVYYHPSFSWDELLRKSSYIGLDGLPSYIHLIFGEKDVQQGRFLMNQRAPDDETLRSIYKALCRLREGGGTVPLTDHEIARFARASLECVGAAIEIFSEIGIIELEGESGQRRIRVKKVEERRDLKESGRYREGSREREEFEKLSSAIFKMSASELSDLIAGPARPINSVADSELGKFPLPHWGEGKGEGK